MWRWQSVQEFQYPLLEYLAAPQERAAVPRRRDGRSRPRAHLDGGHHRPDARRRSTRRRCRPPRPTPRSATPTRWRSGSTASTATTPTRAAAPPTHWNCAVPGSLNAADPSWNATGAEADPRRRRRHGQPRPQQDARSGEVDGRVPSRGQLLRARPPRARRAVQPGRQQRLQRRAPAQLQQRGAAGSRSAWRRSPATAPRTTAANTRVAAQQHRRRPDRQRRRHHLRRHRCLRRADRRRVGCAAGRGPQLVVLRQLRLAQPRQLRPGRPPHDAGLLPRRVPAQLHAGAQRRRQAAAADDRRRPAHRQHLRHRAARSSIASASWPASATRPDGAACAAAGRRTPRSTTPRSTVAGCATMGEKLVVPAGADIVVGDRGARPGGHELLALHLPQPVAAAGRHQPAAEHAGARPHRPDRRPGHRLQDARRAGLRGRVAAQHQLAARGRHDRGSVRGARRGQEHHARRSSGRSAAAAPRPGPP